MTDETPNHLWCAMCAQWGDHASGSCPELKDSAHYSERRFKLWQFFSRTHGLPLMESELDDIIDAVKESKL